jgi:hypothetical protein
MKCSSGSTLAFLALTLISVSAQPTNQPGTLKWEFPTDNLVVECPALGTNGLLYVGNYNGSVYAINTTNGQQVWQVRLDRTLMALPSEMTEQFTPGRKDGVFTPSTGAAGRTNAGLPALHGGRWDDLSFRRRHLRGESRHRR